MVKVNVLENRVIHLFVFEGKNGGPCHAAVRNSDTAIKPLVLLTVLLPRYTSFYFTMLLLL